MPESFWLPNRAPCPRFDQSAPSQAPVKADILFAGTGRRVLAIFFDWFVPFFFVFHGDTQATLAWLAMIGNSIVLQGMTGQSAGKRLAGISLAYIPQRMSETVWTPLIPGVGRCALRYVLHTLDMVFLLGFFRMIFNPFSQTWADSLAHTVVVMEHGTKLQRRDEWLGGQR